MAYGLGYEVPIHINTWVEKSVSLVGLFSPFCCFRRSSVSGELLLLLPLLLMLMLLMLPAAAAFDHGDDNASFPSAKVSLRAPFQSTAGVANCHSKKPPTKRGVRKVVLTNRLSPTVLLFY